MIFSLLPRVLLEEICQRFSAIMSFGFWRNCVNDLVRMRLAFEIFPIAESGFGGSNANVLVRMNLFAYFWRSFANVLVLMSLTFDIFIISKSAFGGEMPTFKAKMSFGSRLDIFATAGCAFGREMPTF